MKVIDVDIKTISPMFSGRGDENFSLTPQSVRGVLRFWFRAVLPRVVNIVDNKVNPELKGEECDWDYKLMHDIESYLFGSTDFKSPFDVIVKFDPRNVSNKKGEYLTEGKYNKYALYGQKNRFYLKKESIINIKFIIKRDIEGLDKLLFYLLKLTSFIGGFGAKSRKGFGSFEIEKAKINDEELNHDDSFKLIIKALNAYIKYTIDDIKNAYNSNSKIFINKDLKKNFSDINKINYLSPEFKSSPTYPTLINRKHKILESQKTFDTFDSLYDYLYKPDPKAMKLKKGESLDLRVGMYVKLKKILRGKYILKNGKIEINGNLEEDSFRKAIYAIDNKEKPSIKFDQSFLGLPINYKIMSGHFPDIGNGSYTLSNSEGRKSSQMFIKTFKENGRYRYRITLIKSKITNDLTYENNHKIDHLKFDKKEGRSINGMGNELIGNIIKLLTELKMVE